MKHKTLLLSFFVLAALVTTSVARAEDNTSDDKGRMEERRGMIIGDSSERKDFMMRDGSGETREGMKIRFDEFTKNRFGTMMEMMTKRFEWAIARLENIADRIEARIEKIEDETDTTLTDARTHLDEARTDIADATKLLSEIDVDIDYITADETKTRERFSGFRDAFSAVKAEIKSAWMHLREALEAMKGERSDNAKKEPMDDWNTNNSR